MCKYFGWLVALLISVQVVSAAPVVTVSKGQFNNFSTATQAKLGLKASIANSPWVDVREFGALTNTDSTVAFILALASGKNIYVPSGTYLISTALPLPSNATIFGDGADKTIIKRKDSTSGFHIFTNSNTSSGNSNIVMRDLTIDGNKDNQLPANGGVGALFIRVANLIVDRVKIVNSNNTVNAGISDIGGFNCDYCQGVVFRNGEISNSATEGARFRSGTNNSVEGGVFQGNGYSGVASAAVTGTTILETGFTVSKTKQIANGTSQISLNGLRNKAILNNISGGGQYCINVGHNRDDGNADGSGSIVAYNHCRSNEGVRVSASRDVHLERNTYSNMGIHAILAGDGDVSGITIDYETIEGGCSQDAILIDAVDVFNAGVRELANLNIVTDRPSVTNTNIRNVQRSGIRLNRATNWTVGGNKGFGFAQGGTMSYGLNVQNDANGMNAVTANRGVAYANTFFDIVGNVNFSNGIKIDPGIDYISMSANNCYGSVSSPIALGNGSRSYIGGDNIGLNVTGGNISPYIEAGNTSLAVAKHPGPVLVNYGVAITADRTVSLTGAATTGMVVRVIRQTAATGGFNVIIGSSLKTLSPGTWAEVVYNGTTWILTASGAI